MKISPSVMIVNDGQDARRALRALLASHGVEVLEANRAQAAPDIAKLKKPDAVVMDVDGSGRDHADLLRKLNLQRVPVIVLDASGSVAGAVAAMRAGAFDYLVTPTSDELVDAVRRATAHRRAAGASPRETLTAAMGHSPSIERLVEQVEAVARSDYCVLILGETGAGKEIVARALHRHSRRAEKPLVTIDCGAIVETLIDSELFGHEKGAYTGAGDRHRGAFEAASDGGTIFLDEIANLPLSGQRAMLRALEERVIHRVGGTSPIVLDVRIICATNEDPGSTNGFRSDLYFRIAEYVIAIPPLRERREDIDYLARRLIAEARAALARSPVEISPAALDLLRQYDWPGNARELRNVMRRAALLAGDSVSVEHVSGALRKPPAQAPLRDGAAPLREQVREIERAALLETLNHAGGNKAEAARMLGIDYKTYRTKLKNLGHRTEVGADVKLRLRPS